MQREAGYLLDMMALPGARCHERDASGIPSNPQDLLKPGSDSFVHAVHTYRQLLARVVLDTQGRKRMSEAAVAYAKTRTWDEAMGCLLKGEKAASGCRWPDAGAETCGASGYRSAAIATGAKRSARLFRTLSRSSSTVSLLDVKIEDPPEQDESISSVSSSSSRLLFGRPPLKGLLRRAGKATIRDSISLRWRATVAATEAHQVEANVATARKEESWLGRHVLIGGFDTAKLATMRCRLLLTIFLSNKVLLVMLIMMTATLHRYAFISNFLPGWSTSVS